MWEDIQEDHGRGRIFKKIEERGYPRISMRRISKRLRERDDIQEDHGRGRIFKKIEGEGGCRRRSRERKDIQETVGIGISDMKLSDDIKGQPYQAGWDGMKVLQEQA